MAQIVTQIIIPLIIAILAVLFEYWVVQPYWKKRTHNRLINNIQELPLQNYILPHKGNLKFPPNNIIVISTLGINICDMSRIGSVKFSRLLPALVSKIGIKDGGKSYSFSQPIYHLYSNWKRMEPDELFLPSMSENSVFVLSQYPYYELLEASDVIQGETINPIQDKPPIDNREARLEYDYRTILNLNRFSRKVKLVNVKNDKTFYRLSFQCKSIKDVKENGEVFLNDQCEAEITIPDGYPAKYPSIRIISKVFHPNIFPNGIVVIRDCYDWLNENYQKNDLSLASMCLITIEMLECHTFNLNNPCDLNAVKKFKYIKSIIPLDISNLKGY